LLEIKTCGTKWKRTIEKTNEWGGLAMGELMQR
jgi:hypothetical protein